MSRYSYFKDLPIIFLDEWDQIKDFDFINSEYEKLINLKMNLQKLTVIWKYEISKFIRTYQHRVLISTDENPIYIQFGHQWPNIGKKIILYQP